jgi:hypothetical protein
MRIFLIVIFLQLVIFARAQESSDQIIFDNPDNDVPSALDSIAVDPQPVIGYDSLFRYLESRLSGRDTLGKKYPLHLEGLRISIRATGAVDSIYIAIPHLVCSIHRLIIQELEIIKWLPARQYGRAIPWNSNFPGSLQLTKRVYKKHRC